MQLPKSWEVQAEIYRRSFYQFSLDAFKVIHNGQSLIDNWHIKYICDLLQQEAKRVVNGEPREKHLVVNVPPRTLKSELVNVFFTAYCWILKPSMQIITTSYSASLSIGLSVQTRRLIESDWFKLHFPYIKLSDDENTKSKFTNKDGGLRYSTSTGGTVTGMGGDIIIIDDPQNPQLSRSDAERQTSNDFFNQTLRSRLNDPRIGMFIVIMQRLHEDDLTGNVLKLEPNEWQHICLPAELNNSVKPLSLKENYIDGLLFPERLSKQVLDNFKVGLGSYGYSGQYMQRPSPAEGGIIKAKWFEQVDTIPEGVTDFFIDTAYTEKQYNDATAILAGVYFNNILYVKNVVAIRLEFPELIKEIPRFSLANGYTSNSRIYIEPKASGLSVIQQLKTTTGLNIIEAYPPKNDKVSRVNAVSAVIEAGRVKLLKGSYIDAFINECVAFPNGAHDDMVDVLTSALSEYTENTPLFFG